MDLIVHPLAGWSVAITLIAIPSLYTVVLHGFALIGLYTVLTSKKIHDLKDQILPLIMTEKQKSDIFNNTTNGTIKTQP